MNLAKLRPLPCLAQKDVEKFKRFLIRAKDCWYWKGNGGVTYEELYRPRFYYAGSYYIATRVLWLIVNGSDPGKKLVLHKCGKHKCVNPEHLYLGSAVENANDRTRDNPGLWEGRRNPAAILTESDVKKIRQRIKHKTYKQLAITYGVHISTIHDIVKRRTWRHL